MTAVGVCVIPMCIVDDKDSCAEVDRNAPAAKRKKTDSMVKLERDESALIALIALIVAQMFFNHWIECY